MSVMDIYYTMETTSKYNKAQLVDTSKEQRFLYEESTQLIIIKTTPALSTK